MAIWMTKDAVTQASLLMIAVAVFLICPPTAEVTAHAVSKPQVEMQPDPGQIESASFDSEARTPVALPVPASDAFWIAAAVGILLIGVSSGAIAAAIVLRGRRDAHAVTKSDNVSEEFDAVPVEARTLAWTQLIARAGVGLFATRIKFKRWLYHTAKSARSRLRRLIPSRPTVLRLACLFVGTGLVVLSLGGFAKGRVWESSILLPIGYGIATCFWLLSWKREQVGPDAEEIAFLAEAKQKSLTPQPAAVRLEIVAPTKPPGHVKPPSPHFSVSADTVDNLPALSTADTVENVPAATAFQPLNPLLPGYAAQLRCAPCNKQFNVRGQGEIAFRLVPCPDCGSAMESLAPNRPDVIPADPNWVPIVSVFCKSCRSLIDVPYSTFGSSISCPRCHADLSVPQIARPAVQPSTQSQLMPA